MTRILGCCPGTLSYEQGHSVFVQGLHNRLQEEIKGCVPGEAFCLPGIPHMHHNPLRRWSLMIAHPRPLIEVFAAIPDFRQPRGKRHPLAAIFALACCAMLCGYRSYSAMAEWGHSQRPPAKPEA